MNFHHYYYYGYNVFMIGLLWLVMTRMFRFLEMASGQAVTVLDPEVKRRKGSYAGQDDAGDMTEDNHSRPVNIQAPYEPDCNSNCAPLTTGRDAVTSSSRLSNVSSNDGEVHDASDYQWFADFGYKDQQQQNQGHRPAMSGSGTTTNGRRHHPRSILAALDSPISPLHPGDFTYEDLSRNIDANLAEIDMEDFRSEDINSILALPAMYCGDFQRSQNRGEQAASLSGSLMAAAFESMRHSCTSGESTDMSVCKSEQLFSPLKDTSGLPTFSVDSLDCDSFNEQELMLTCQANMNNYTIAFEGSFARYSDDSDYHEAAGSETSDSESWSGQFKLRSSDSIDGSLVQSDLALTTWSKLKRAGSEAAPEPVAARNGSQSPVSAAACKSQSLPNLFRKSGTLSDIKISQLNVSTDSEQCVPVYDVQSSSQSRCSDTSSQQSVSLMRLFMQRTSSSQSIAHSLSSGTLQQLDTYGSGTNDNLTSADERLRCVLNGQLDDSGGDAEDSGQQAQAPTTLISSHHRSKIPEAAKNGSKSRRLKMSPSANACKLFGADGSHEDGMVRAGSPLASPIQEEDENEENISGGDCPSPADGRRRGSRPMHSSYCDSMEGSIGQRVQNRGSDINGFQTGRSTPDRTLGTQTRRLNKSLPQPDSSPVHAAFPYLRSKSSDEGSVRDRSGGANDISSSSSGYKSIIRNSGTEQPLKPRRKFGGLISTTKSCGTQIPVHVSDEAIQTSFKGEWLQKVLANCARMRVRDRVVQAGGGRTDEATEKGDENGGSGAGDKRPVYVCYPNYSLPDLAFLRSSDGQRSVSKMILVPTKPVLSPCSQRTVAATVARYCGTREELRRADFSHVQDWDSLNVLLPREVRDMLVEIRAKGGSEAREGGESERKKAEEATPDGSQKEDFAAAQPLGFGAEAPMTLQSPTSESHGPEGKDAEEGRPETGRRRPPPLPKRSISLPQGDSGTSATGQKQVAAKPPLPKGILRRSGAGTERRQPPQRYSMSDFLALQQQQERHLNRHSGQQSLAEQCNCFVAQEVQLVGNCPLSEELARMLGMSRRACGCCGSPLVNNVPQGRQAALGPCSRAMALDGCGNGQGTDRHRQCPSQPSKAEEAAAVEGKEEDLQQAQDAKNKKTVSFSSGFRPMSEQCTHLERRGDGLKSDGADKEWPSLTSDDGDIGAPQEFCVSPIKDGDGINAPSLLPEVNTSSSYWQRKRDLVVAVVDAVEILNAHFGRAKDPRCKFIIGSCLQTPLTGYKVVHHLCPALFTVLSDGLHQEVYNLFGHVGNSVWMVVEAVSQSGHCTKQMSDLVVHVNNEQGLWEKHTKFNAFVFGLLNIRSLDTWFSLLGTCSGILQKHYSPNAFLYSANAATKTLFDGLLLSLQTLSLLPFDLDLALETNPGSRQETQSGCDYNHNCLLHRDVPCCRSWMAVLSKSTPVACANESPRHSPLARRSCAGQCREDGAGSPRTPEHRLRRNHSQDSAIATGSSGSSENSTAGETPWRFDVRSPQRPRSCTLAPRTNDPVPLDKRLSCGNLESDADSGSGASDRRGKWDKFREAAEGNKTLEARDPVITDLMDGCADAKVQSRKEEEFNDGVRQYAEKGALDATIAEDRDSQNNIKDAGEDEKGEDDEDGAKFKELQLRWEILSCAAAGSDKKQQQQQQQLQRTASANARSKIPRLVTPPLRSGSRMDDSAVSVRTSACGISSPDGSSYKTLICEGAPEEQRQVFAEAGPKAKTKPNPESNRNNPVGRPASGVLKVPASGQPAMVVKTSADRSPAARKRASPRKTAAGSPVATPQTKHRQSVSRGVGGPEKAEN